MLGKAVGKHAFLCLLAITLHVCIHTYTDLLNEVMLLGITTPSTIPKATAIKKSNASYGKPPFKLLVQNNVHDFHCPYYLPDIEGK